MFATTCDTYSWKCSEIDLLKLHKNIYKKYVKNIIGGKGLKIPPRLILWILRLRGLS